jgi:hypothetical protein
VTQSKTFQEPWIRDTRELEEFSLTGFFFTTTIRGTRSGKELREESGIRGTGLRTFFFVHEFKPSLNAIRKGPRQELADGGNAKRWNSSVASSPPGTT